MKKVFIFLSILGGLICFSCLSDKQKQTQANKLASDKIGNVDMTTIDHYPVFDICDEMLTSPDCFYRELHKEVDNKLKFSIIPIRLSAKDSVYVSITVSKLGVIKYDSIFKCAEDINRTEVHKLFKRRLIDFPIVESARKMSIPISTTYKLPIVFSPVDSLGY